MSDDVVMQGWIEGGEWWDGSASSGERAFDGGAFDGGAFDESDFLEGLRAALPAYAGLPAEALAEVAAEAMARMTPEEAAAFESWFSGVGNALKKIGQTILPAAAPIIGGAIGGPAGAMIGQAVGQFAGKALGGRPVPTPAAPGVPAMPTTPAAPGVPAMPLATGAAGAPAAGGDASSAIAQLMAFLQDPTLLLSMARELLGGAVPAAAPSPAPAGAPGLLAPKPPLPIKTMQAAAPAAAVVSAAAESIPFGALMDTLSVLAHHAAAESAARGASGWNAESTAYLMAGDTLGWDPVVPEERAMAVLEQLRAVRASAERADGVAGNDDARWTTEEGVTAWLAEAGMLA